MENSDNEIIDEQVEICDDELAVYIDIEWHYHPLRKFLYDKICAGEIPADYKLMRPFDVWNKFCDDPVFEGFEYDATFTRRLLALRKQIMEGKSRAEEDIKAFEIAKANHPVPAFNHRGEPQWNGSDAQRLLQEDMKDKKHFDLKPEHLWESRKEYQMFELTTFRDHLHQAWKTQKYLYTLKVRAEKKEKERKEAALAKQKQKPTKK